ILYTGDFSRQEDRHLMAAEIPSVKPDILITESTYGTHIHEKREERESRFCNTVQDIVNREGRCLIPVFALGRAQELLLSWNHPERHDIPIYYASSLARKCMAVYQTYINAMNDKIRKAININNPFRVDGVPRHDAEWFVPRAVRELVHRQRNGVIIAGYCVEGTLAKHIMTEPDEICTMSGQKLPLKMSVDYISFSAHTDYQQTSEFIRALKPPHVILVHGEQNEMARLKAALIREYEDNDEVDIEVHNPRNTEAVTLNFRGEKLAKVMGSLTDRKCVQGQRVSGILVKRNFNYHIVTPADLSSALRCVQVLCDAFRCSAMRSGALRCVQVLCDAFRCSAMRSGALRCVQVPCDAFRCSVMRSGALRCVQGLCDAFRCSVMRSDYTDLCMSTVTQTQAIPYSGPISLLVSQLRCLAGDVEQLEAERVTVRVFKSITLVHEAGMVLLEWIANPLNDMYADAVTTVVLEVQSNPNAQKFMEGKKEAFDMDLFVERLELMLHDMFGDDCVNFREGKDLSVTVDGVTATIDPETR
ncbi:hypothetical protein KUCAC02_037882, partial [Chaenocephalus aceratus]